MSPLDAEAQRQQRGRALRRDRDLRRDWDVVVVGAGPAGSVAAANLAAAGAEVLLVDRLPLGRVKACGGCVNRAAVERLRRQGLGLDRALEGGVPLREFRVMARGRRVRWPLAGGVVVDRTRFDAALTEAAIEAGAAHLPAVTARVEGLEGPWRRVRLRGDGVDGAVYARVVVVASGLGRAVEASSALTWRPRPGARLGLHAVLERDHADVADGAVVMAYGRGGYVGLTRRPDGRLTLAAALDPEVARAGVDAAVAELLDDAGLDADAVGLRDAGALSWHGTPPLTGTPRAVAEERVFAIGDAAGYVEPFTGEGIGWAIAGACEAAPFVRAALAGPWRPTLARAWTRTHRRRIARAQLICRAIAGLSRHPALARAVLATLARAPVLARPFLHAAQAA
jgi:flavin-dependent dehydrogenase